MRTAMKSLVVVTALVTAAWTGRALADNNQGNGAAPKEARDFMIKAHQANVDEVELAHLAEARATMPSVKEFAQRMVKDHTKADAELAQLAGQQGVSLPAGISRDMQATKDRLSNLKGMEFDREFMKQMAHDHEMVVGLFQKELGTTSDPQLKNWLGKTLPALDDHLKNAAMIDQAAIDAHTRRQ